jgi:hyperpolarization activated cyclic nucleotide-gated potassium channel 1
MESTTSDKNSYDVDTLTQLPKEKLAETKSLIPFKSTGGNSGQLFIHPTNTTSIYKYKKVWSRALLKLKMRKAFSSFKDQIILYGTSYEIEEFSQPDYDFNKAYENYNHRIEERKIKDLNEVAFPRQLIHPESKFKKVWSIILALLLIYTGVLMPVRLAFFDAVYWDSWTIFDTTIDFFFLVDVVINCFSSYPKPDGSYETNHRKIIKNYLKSWMLLDIVASIPFSLIEAYAIPNSNEGDTSYNSIMKLMRLPRLYGLLRVSRMFKLIKTYKSSGMLDSFQEILGINMTKAKFIVFMLSLSLLVHIMGCVWYFSAKLQDFAPDTWVGAYDIIDESKMTHYISSVYWTLTTLATIGYGDITPQNDLERMVCITWMIFGVGFYTYIIGSLSSLIFQLDTKRIQLTQRLYLIDQFCKESNLPLDLKISLRNAVKYSTSTTGISLEAKFDFLNELPKELRYKISRNLYKGAVDSIPFLQNKDTSFISYLMPLLSPYQLQDEEIVYEEGNYADEMYFLTKGRVNLVYGEKKLVYKSYLKGSYFGEIEILDKSGRLDSVIAVGVCDFLSLEKSYLMKLVEDYPKEGGEIRKVARERRTRHIKEKNYLKDTLEKLVNEC